MSTLLLLAVLATLSMVSFTASEKTRNLRLMKDIVYIGIVSGFALGSVAFAMGHIYRAIKGAMSDSIVE